MPNIDGIALMGILNRRDVVARSLSYLRHADSAALQSIKLSATLILEKPFEVNQQASLHNAMAQLSNSETRRRQRSNSLCLFSR
jgi:DNA-binding NtrC family response regulator